MPFTKMCTSKLANPLMKYYLNLNGKSPLSKLSNSLNSSSFKFISCSPHIVCRELNTVSGVAIRPQTITKDDKRDFMAVFPDIVRDLTQLNPGISDLSTLISKLMQYNVSGGKKVRGLTVVYSYRMLAPDHALTPENIRLAQILGWCVEMLQGFFVVIDDLADQSVTRRGRPCWYRLPGVGLRASSDALLIQSGCFQLLQQHCKDKEFYVDLVELFLDALRRTTYGQTLDYVSSFPNINHLTMDRYNFITKYKTAYYTYHLPVATAMYMAGIYNAELHRQAKSVLLEMGHYFQVQDDYLDVFGDEEMIGKKGTDIQEGKCTWLAIIAFQRASPPQREVLESCYGTKEPEKIKKVKDIFIELSLPAVYHAYEEETYNLITRQIQQLSQGLPHELFLTLLHKLYGRKQ
uniref:Farnesyl pyrophosphate synthase n=1 Tax=Murgantia histrionica TaxID=460024 RepID=FPPS_MURHI|nr:RecName: Full=Farnesyl pyrophosphate synthase; Short=MhFPPS; Short=MhIDS-2 [Murgantia histrionica]AVZ23978.1 farnesyl diphosphate synthase [Murgantia histrionica]